jgi:soluble lytic murein transglycosylase
MAAWSVAHGAVGVRRRVRRAAKKQGSIAKGILWGTCAALAGATLGLVASPGPQRNDGVENFAWTAAAAVQTAQRSEERARVAEQALAEARARLEQVAQAVQEMQDFREAQRLGLDRAMSSRGGFDEVEKKRVLAAIVREARRQGLDPVMVAAVIEVESRFDPFAKSHVGACGLMQLMPPTANELLAARQRAISANNAAEYGGKWRVDARHLFNPVLNVELGTAYLARLLHRFDGDAQRALIAYNAGPSVARSIVRGSKSFRRLQAYPRAVLAAYRSLLLAQQETGVRLAQG